MSDTDRLQGLHDLSEDAADLAARKELHCRGCGGEKNYGCSVCWSCFKGDHGIESLKYSGMLFKEYLSHLDATGQTAHAKRRLP